MSFENIIFRHCIQGMLFIKFYETINEDFETYLIEHAFSSPTDPCICILLCIHISERMVCYLYLAIWYQCCDQRSPIPTPHLPLTPTPLGSKPSGWPNGPTAARRPAPKWLHSCATVSPKQACSPGSMTVLLNITLLPKCVAVEMHVSTKCPRTGVRLASRTRLIFPHTYRCFPPVC